MATAQEVQKLEREKLARIGKWFAFTPDGKDFVKMLEGSYFEGDLRGKTTEETYFKLGEREVVRFIQGLRDSATTET